MSPAAALEPGMQIAVQGGGPAAIKIFLLLTALSFASAALVAVSAFTRIVIVLAFVRQGLGTPSLPPTQVVIALALALSGFVMAPTAKRVYADALAPYFDDKISGEVAAEAAAAPLRDFLLRQTRADDLKLFYEISREPAPTRADTVPLTIAIPAFMVSELTTAFRMGLFVYVPLLLIDLLVAAVLVSLGMSMVPPTLISLPLKVGVFLLADGWHLLASSLVRSFG